MYMEQMLPHPDCMLGQTIWHRRVFPGAIPGRALDEAGKNHSSALPEEWATASAAAARDKSVFKQSSFWLLSLPHTLDLPILQARENSLQASPSRPHAPLGGCPVSQVQISWLPLSPLQDYLTDKDWGKGFPLGPGPHHSLH